MARKTRFALYDALATKDGFPSDDPVPLFLSDHAEEPEPPDTRKVWETAAISSRHLKTSILVVTAAAIVFAVFLAVGNSVPLFSSGTASLPGTSAAQSVTGQLLHAVADEQEAPST